MDVGGSATAEFTLYDKDLSIWDVDTHSLKLVQGNFDIYIGASNRDIKHTMQMTV
jgi:hypothetical protein